MSTRNEKDFHRPHDSIALQELRPALPKPLDSLLHFLKGHDFQHNCGKELVIGEDSRIHIDTGFFLRKLERLEGDKGV